MVRHLKQLAAFRKLAQPGTRLRLVAQAYTALMVLLSLVQLGLGGNPILDITYLAIALIPVGLIDRDNLYPSDVLFFSLSMYFAGMSLIFKTMLGQPVQSNLESPNLSALYLIAAFVSITLAYYLLKRLRRVPVRARVFMTKVFDQRQFVSLMAKGFFFFGFATQFLAAVFRPHAEAGELDQSSGFGGFGAFYFMMLFGFAAQAGMVWKYKGNSLEKNILVAMLVGILGVSMISNVKKPLYDAIILIIICVYAFRIKIKPQAILILLVGLMFMQMIVSPLIHIVRYEGKALTPGDRINATMQILEENDYDFNRIRNLYSTQAATMQEFRADSSYYYPSTLNLDRFSLILPTDQVVRTGDPGRLQLGEQLALSVNEILPQPIVTHKLYAGVDEIAWNYGIRDWGVIGRPVIGIAASSYAVGGFWAVLFIPGISYGIFFWLIDAFFGRLTGNIASVGIAAYMAQYAEEDIMAIYTIAVREVMVIIVVLLFFCALYVVAARKTGEKEKDRPVSMRRKAMSLPR